MPRAGDGDGRRAAGLHPSPQAHPVGPESRSLHPSPCIPERGRRQRRGTAGQSHPGPRQLLPSEGNHRAAGSQQGTGCGGAQAPLSPAAHPNPMGQGSHPVAIWDKNTKIRESSGAFALAAARSPAQVSSQRLPFAGRARESRTRGETFLFITPVTEPRQTTGRREARAASASPLCACCWR